jgi:hypothetical protein
MLKDVKHRASMRPFNFQWKKIFFKVVFLISALAVLRVIDLVRYERDPKAFMPTDPWWDYNGTYNTFWPLRYVIAYFYNGAEPPGESLILGEFAPGSPEVDYMNRILSGDGRISLRYVNIVISCDFESGELYSGFSNVEMLKRREHIKNRMIQSGRYFKNANGDPYDGGDTILERTFTLKSEDLSRLKERYP